MEIDAIFGQVRVFLAIIASISALYVTFRTIRKFKGEKAKELHAQYVKLKELVKNTEENYAEILVILSGLTTAKLSKDEIEWFISEPGAFLKLEQYGRVNGRYSEINLIAKEFALPLRFRTRKGRVIERIKIVLFSVLLVLMLSSFWYLMVFNLTTPEFFLYIALALLSAYILVVLWGGHYLWSTLSKAVDLAGKL
ncbi:TPA: hypothetical protein NGT44_004588 [Vibrio parahaemolyticus]|uniref:hypothetical protein n=1 Tax=Vibrio parahaemolyticus TaxID=670 RepID=UPI00111EAF13|nr:hypothetical protein [Vibrio parahaemolyticus]TOQ48221.1 hypothetical protein CGG94_24105 [Vibrio parahaemolyticus]HCE2180945.1 hypothetical protein [Vibrio parahaemolyticus]HCG7544568.1 hypothetical protein [Vibrio parahaemolyticus]HCH0358753.1 hypothetical protein [Vibrio parahaemolyticus]HCH5750495.1 hypothetical protein [Vibrio parahaemolyticus]